MITEKDILNKMGLMMQKSLIEVDSIGWDVLMTILNVKKFKQTFAADEIDFIIKNSNFKNKTITKSNALIFALDDNAIIKLTDEQLVFMAERSDLSLLEEEEMEKLLKIKKRYEEYQCLNKQLEKKEKYHNLKI